MLICAVMLPTVVGWKGSAIERFLFSGGRLVKKLIGRQVLGSGERLVGRLVVGSGERLVGRVFLGSCERLVRRVALGSGRRL